MKKRKEFLVFGEPDIQSAEIEEVVRTMQSKWLGTGPKVHQFEEEFAQYLGAPHAVALSSCTAALHLALITAGLKPGDQVITTPMTFCATANAIIHAGCVPVFVDCKRETFNIDPGQIESAINEKTKAILPVHFAGLPCEMEPIVHLARKYDLKLIEDAAHCIEGEYCGQKIGTIGDATCFSFYVTKNLTTVEGGMFVTPHLEWADRVKVFGLHGMDRDAWRRYSDSGFKHYEVVFPGFKYNMTDLQASLGIHQLKRISSALKRREEIWKKYDRAFSDLAIDLPASPPSNVKHARHLYPVLVRQDFSKSRDQVQQGFHERNIGTGIHYTSLHLHRYYRETYHFASNDYPNAAEISERTLSLPLSSSLSDEDIHFVIEAAREVLS